MDKSKNVFISHFHGDDAEISKLKDLLGRKGYQLKNSSIDSTKPNQATNDEYIRRLLRLRIQWASTVIVLISNKTHTRDWVNWEIDQANKKGKRIIGVFVNGASDSNIPESFKKYGQALVGWTGNKIIDAIEGHNNFETSTGDIAPNNPNWTSIRSNC
jgi:hypothetical protein